MAQVITATTTLGLQVTLGSLTRTTDVDLILNVYRRQESILYKSSHSIEAANVAYVSSKPVISTSAMHIADKSQSLIANHIEKLDAPVNIENLSEYDVPTDKFVVTDVYIEDISGTPVPLFFKHILSTATLPRVAYSDITIDSDYKLTAVEVLDINFEPVQLDNIKIDWDEGVIYNNLVSSFDQTNSRATIYYLRYSIKDADGLITSYVELVSNQNIFTMATLDDLDDTLQIIDDGRKVFLIEEQESSLHVRLPALGNYSFQLLDNARIHILPPPQSDIQDPWNVIITNGKFFSSIGGTTYKYSIPEFINQGWDPTMPYKTVTDEDAEYISQSLVKVRRSNVYDVPVSSGYIDLLVYDAEDAGVAAFSTDPTKEGTVAINSQFYQMWNREERVGIRSVDAKAGILDIDGLDLRSDYKLRSYYSYEETDYEFTSVDFNPVNNPDILAKFVSIFVDPDTDTTAKNKTVYFTITDKSGKVVRSNLPFFDNDNELIQTNDNVWREAYLARRPSYASPVGSILFMSQYTVVGSGVFLPLGDIYVSEDSHPQRSTVIDTRVRGGGIKEDEIEAVRVLQPELEWYWDLGFWDGIPYPGSASMYVEVPASVLEVAGGTLKTNEVRAIVDRHTAAGVYTIAKAYGIDPVISGVVPASGQLTISWGSYE